MEIEQSRRENEQSRRRKLSGVVAVTAGAAFGIVAVTRAPAITYAIVAIVAGLCYSLIAVLSRRS
jgi:ammonia channel protein AmtB